MSFWRGLPCGMRTWVVRVAQILMLSGRTKDMTLAGTALFATRLHLQPFLAQRLAEESYRFLWAGGVLGESSTRCVYGPLCVTQSLNYSKTRGGQYASAAFATACTRSSIMIWWLIKRGLLARMEEQVSVEPGESPPVRAATRTPAQCRCVLQPAPTGIQVI